MNPSTEVPATTLSIPVEYEGKRKFLLMSILRGGSPTDGVTYSTLRLRCLDCNWGYNSNPTFVTTEDTQKIAERMPQHGEDCPNTGRTIDVGSPEIG